MPLKCKTALGLGSQGGVKTEKLHGASCLNKYSGRSLAAILFAEHAGLIARVVSSGGKLYMVGYLLGRAR